MKCQTLIDDSQLIDDDDFIKKFLKQNFLRFHVSLYQFKSKSNDDKFLIDLVLVKGNPMLFIDLAKGFICESLKACHVIHHY